VTFGGAGWQRAGASGTLAIMCGINGVFHYGPGLADVPLIRRQSDAMRHRGPDDGGEWSNRSAALGHRRLAILDLSPTGHQPMANEDSSVWVTFNGEIYEHDASRRALEAQGHRFRGRSDTEILVHAYEQYGDAVVDRLRGKFAFGLYDERRNRLLLARDRLGIKPLYYHDDGERLTFASELAALMLDPDIPREIDEQALVEYLALQYVPSPRTIWKNVRKLPPGHRLVCDVSGAREERYWSPPPPDPSLANERELPERLRELIADAVNVRMVADVPVGAFLSGGLDSATVVACMARQAPGRVSTFTIGFREQQFSELEEARAIAQHFGTDHHECVLGPEAVRDLPQLIAAMGEPFADASIIPTYHVSKLAGRDLKVVLSGDGGDEVFGGYKTYPAAARHARLGWIPAGVRQAVGASSRWLDRDHARGRKMRRAAMDVLARHFDAVGCFPDGQLGPLLSASLRERTIGCDPFGVYRGRYREALAGSGEVGALLRADLTTYLVDDVLHKVDSASMLNSLEVRCPLLDQRVVEFAAALPLNFKLRGRTTKWLLREAMRDQLPSAVLSTGKKGFNLPLEYWLEGGLGTLTREVLLDPRARSRGWFDPREVDRLLAGRAGGGERARQLWSLLCLELWAQAHLDTKPDLLARPA
jgi:asparagine synthase (glutamine-hydrolysing)